MTSLEQLQQLSVENSYPTASRLLKLAQAQGLEVTKKQVEDFVKSRPS